MAAKYYVGARPGEKYVRILERNKGVTLDRTLSICYNVQNAQFIVNALNTLEKYKEQLVLKKPLKK